MTSSVSQSFDHLGVTFITPLWATALRLSVGECLWSVWPLTPHLAPPTASSTLIYF